MGAGTMTGVGVGGTWGSKVGSSSTNPHVNRSY